LFAEADKGYTKWKEKHRVDDKKRKVFVYKGKYTHIELCFIEVPALILSESKPPAK